VIPVFLQPGFRQMVWRAWLSLFAHFWMTTVALGGT